MVHKDALVGKAVEKLGEAGAAIIVEAQVKAEIPIPVDIGSQFAAGLRERIIAQHNEIILASPVERLGNTADLVYVHHKPDLRRADGLSRNGVHEMPILKGLPESIGATHAQFLRIESDKEDIGTPGLAEKPHRGKHLRDAQQRYRAGGIAVRAGVELAANGSYSVIMGGHNDIILLVVLGRAGEHSHKIMPETALVQLAVTCV